jgi:hypothetical protein
VADDITRSGSLRNGIQFEFSYRGGARWDERQGWLDWSVVGQETTSALPPSISIAFTGNIELLREAGCIDERMWLTMQRGRLRETAATAGGIQSASSASERLRPDMTTDELQAAIKRAVAKHRQLQRGLQGKEIGHVLEAVPRAAELCCERITLGVSGDAKASEEARYRIRLSSQWAHCNTSSGAIASRRIFGHGEGISHVPAVRMRVRVR